MTTAAAAFACAARCRWISIPFLKTKFALLAGGLFLALVAWRLLDFRLGASDREAIRRVLRQRDAALQKGDGAAYDALADYPGPVERTVASSLARAVRARGAFLVEVARRLGPAAAFETGRALPYLREFGPEAIDGCVVEGNHHQARARIGEGPPVEFIRAASGWKLNLFRSPVAMVLVDLESATSAFESARARARREGLAGPAAALRLFTGKFNNY